MKKFCKKLSLILIILLFTFTSNAYAEVANNSNIYKNTALTLLQNIHSNKKIENEISLYDVNGVEDFILYNPELFTESILIEFFILK